MSLSMMNGSFSRHSKQPDLTRWDLFICVACRPEGIALTRLAHVLHVERERSLIVPLGALEDDNLIVSDGDRYTLANNRRAHSLKLTMAYALAYDYDYNAYFETGMLEFLRRAYRADYFTKHDVPKEYILPHVISRLVHNDLLLIYEFKPFMGKIVENPFLDGLCEFLGITRAKSFFPRRKYPVERVIANKLEAMEKGEDPQIQYAKDLLGENNLTDQGWGLGKTSQHIKDSVQKEDTELFDPSSSGCFDSAWDLMHENIKNGLPLTLDVIKGYHAKAMANTDFAGVIRDHDVFVPNNPSFKTSPPDMIVDYLEQLVETVANNTPESFTECLEFAAYVYNQFIFIHPFEDGNSRTARVILAHILNQTKMPFEKIPSSYEVRFLQVTKGLKKRSDEELRYLMEELYLNYINRCELKQLSENQNDKKNVNPN